MILNLKATWTPNPTEDIVKYEFGYISGNGGIFPIATDLLPTSFEFAFDLFASVPELPPTGVFNGVATFYLIAYDSFGRKSPAATCNYDWVLPGPPSKPMDFGVVKVV